MPYKFSRNPVKTFFMVFVLGLIGTGLWFSYQWYQSQYLRAFLDQEALFDGSQLQLPAALQGQGPIRMVHFWDPACPCNVGNQQHLAELMQHYDDEQVQFYVVQKPGSKGKLPEPLAKLVPLQELRGAESLPASPAVAIWDTQGELAYVGPYSEGAVCNADNSFIEPILNALLNHRSVRASNSLAVGCFCDWQTE